MTSQAPQGRAVGRTDGQDGVGFHHAARKDTRCKTFNGFFLEFSSQSLGLWVTSVCVRVDMCVFVCIGMLCVHA